MNKKLLEIKEDCLKKIKINQKRSNFYANIRLLLFFLWLLFVILHLNIFGYFMIVLFIVVCIFHVKIKKKMKEQMKYLEIIQKYENRTNNSWKEEEKEIIQLDNSYGTDINVFGENGLFKYLDFTFSLNGKKKLLSKLRLNDYQEEEILENQKAIQELTLKVPFLLEFQKRMSEIAHIKEIDYQKHLIDLNKKTNCKDINLYISLLFSFLTIGTFVLSMLTIIKPYIFVGLLFFQIIVSNLYMHIYKTEFQSISENCRKFQNLKNVFELFEKEKFKAKKNQQIKEDILKGKEVLKKLIGITNLDTLRLNFLTYLFFNIFGSLNFILLYQYTHLLKENFDAFKKSILSLEEFETLISFTTIGLVKKEICIPKIIKEVKMDFSSLKHPLLQEETCQANDFQTEKDIIIITGSNMSGKTTFMKTIAVNLLLAYNGSYVNAKEFKAPIGKLFTSINVQDDITNGISTFYAELKKIKEILNYSELTKNLMIIFIDEIFKGTNYNDRILGATEIVKRFSKLNCIVLLTTHDFELCQLDNKEIKNYHFAENYQNGKILFDYKIKKGQCKTTNAKYLMKELGIID